VRCGDGKCSIRDDGMGNCPGGINVPGNMSGENVRFLPELRDGDTSVYTPVVSWLFLACHVLRSIST